MLRTLSSTDKGFIISAYTADSGMRRDEKVANFFAALFSQIKK